MIRIGFFAILATLILLATALTFAQAEVPATRPAGAPATRPAPDPKLSPADVVKAVLTAMQHNNDPSPDAGIATVFEFASPGNRAQTGPLERFTKMVKTPAYAPMLEFVKAEYSPVKQAGNQAEQLVRITDVQGNRFIYLFILSRQTDGPYKDCWMTDGVAPANAQPAPAAPGDAPVKT